MERKNRTRWRWGGLALAALLALGTSGCDDEACVSCDAVVVVEDCCGTVADFTVEVFAIDARTGAGIPGAEIDLIVASPPEQRFLAVTDPDGFVRFGFAAPVDSVAVAYACAGGYPCNGGEVALSLGDGPLVLFIEL